ncbi:MAG TPA: cupin domain-containing protein [Chloroflexota bacterium]
MSWATARIAPDYDVLAPDGSEIRELVQTSRGSMVHCTLPAGHVTRAVRHRSVDEVWYCLAGNGEVWRRAADAAQAVDPIVPGAALSIPGGVEFQFRALGEAALEILIVTMPPWPGADEAVAVEGHWPPAV